MFHIGDFIIYSSHGICHIDDICEKTFGEVTRNYYELHPLEDCKLKISVPVDSDKVNILELINKDEAEEILESFSLPESNWIETSAERDQIYSDIVKTGNRKEIAKIVNTLMRKKCIAEAGRKKFHEHDSRFLAFVQNILFAELAMSLGTTFEAINEKIMDMIAISEEKPGVEEIL